MKISTVYAMSAYILLVLGILGKDILILAMSIIGFIHYIYFDLKEEIRRNSR